jgi:guanylate kinase
MASLLGKSTEGLVFVISAPAGTGKTTLTGRLIQEFSPRLIVNVSYTTRKPRRGEISGEDYHFIGEEEFKAKIAAGEFLEYVKLYGDYYGTSRQWVREQQRQGKHVILVIDTQGALQLKNHFPAVFIFISPPSLESLRLRLMNRRTESSETIQQRLKWAEIELQAIPYYDYQVVNDDNDLEEAYQVLRSIVIAECHRLLRE